MEIKTGYLYHIKNEYFYKVNEKYIDHVHTLNGAPAKVGSLLKEEILNNFKNLMKLHYRGYKVFFSDIDKIKKQKIEELNNVS